MPPPSRPSPPRVRPARASPEAEPPNPRSSSDPSLRTRHEPGPPTRPSPHASSSPHASDAHDASPSSPAAHRASQSPSPPAPDAPCLLLRVRRADGDLEQLARAGLTIGSSPAADLALDDPAVAPRHCRIVERRGALVLIDHGAGTALNFRRLLEPTPLAVGDTILVGAHVIEVLAPPLDPARIAARLRRGPPLFGATTLASRPAPPPPRRRTGRLAALAAALAAATALITALTADAPASPPPREAPPRVTPPPSPAPPPAIAAIEHEVIPAETLADVAALYGVPREQLARWNSLRPTAALAPGQRLRVLTDRPPVVRELVRHRVRKQDSWDSLARRFAVDLATLRAHTPHLGAGLRPGDLVDLWLPRGAPATAPAPAAPLVPPDATSGGKPSDAGRLERGLQLPAHPDYDLRCPFNAHASSFTAAHLLAAIADLRRDYRGQLVLGDLSREDGGAYGPHLSHQSGRDVDVWLPIVGGQYRAAPECRRCGTPWCRPEPTEIDWRATWRLVAALARTGAVRQIFLDRSHHAALREAARAAGLDDAALARAIQARPGAPALVTHSAGHTRHLHVRFRCGPDEPSCDD